MSCFGGNRKKPTAKDNGYKSEVPVQQQNRDTNRKGTNVSMKFDQSNVRGTERNPGLTQMQQSQMKALKKVDVQYQTSTVRQSQDLVFKGMNAVKMDVAVRCKQPEQMVRYESYFDESRSDPKVAALERTGLANYRTQDNSQSKSTVVKRFMYDNEAKCMV